MVQLHDSSNVRARLLAGKGSVQQWKRSYMNNCMFVKVHRYLETQSIGASKAYAYSRRTLREYFHVRAQTSNHPSSQPVALTPPTFNLLFTARLGSHDIFPSWWTASGLVLNLLLFTLHISIGGETFSIISWETIFLVFTCNDFVDALVGASRASKLQPEEDYRLTEQHADCRRGDANSDTDHDG